MTGWKEFGSKSRTFLTFADTSDKCDDCVMGFGKCEAVHLSN